ncbi:MAG: hypothetical protein L0H84_04675, partial [Pseudonocardia sp.]|nr:hypothetical protein [Pseudonocardia sp.]
MPYPTAATGTTVELFSNEEFRLEIEPHPADGFHVPAPPVARQLGFREAFDLLRSIPDTEKGSEIVRTPGGDQRVSYLTEAGFYRALGQRQTARITDPDARAFVERFQSWVFGVVLPGLRRGEGGTQVAVRPQSQIDILRAALDQLEATQLAAERAEHAAIEAAQGAQVANARIDALEGRHDWFSALGYARVYGLPTDTWSLQ